MGVISRLLEEDVRMEVSVAAATKGQEQEGTEGQRPAYSLRTCRVKDKSGFVQGQCESALVVCPSVSEWITAVGPDNGMLFSSYAKEVS